ncbi:ThiF family protein [Spironucleus salmonicida]|uniref:ThiF family protein n=1 Tax=Spironucleus salmonicida TaxID=348837 RepID=V6LU70_9EUKA|nr:ThiF family protein [Spironucleus salmonicida]|eukprot:EST47798.1 ThiF family protein [Spironucleus salmonicida]
MINLHYKDQTLQFEKKTTIAALFKQLSLQIKLESQQIRVLANGKDIPYSRKRIGTSIPDNASLIVIPIIQFTPKSVKRAQKSLKKSHSVYFLNSATLQNFVSNNTDIAGLLRNIEQHLGYFNINYIVAEQFMQIYDIFLQRHENFQ